MYTYTSGRKFEIYFSSPVDEVKIKIEEVSIDGQRFERRTFPNGLVLEFGENSDGQRVIRSNRQLLQTVNGLYLETQ